MLRRMERTFHAGARGTSTRHFGRETGYYALVTIIDATAVKRNYSIILASLNYAPEQTGIAPYSTTLAEGLAALGVKVEVLTGYPHYPQWKQHAGYTGITMKQQFNGVSVKRLRHRIPRIPKFLPRVHMELSYGLRAILAKWHTPDVVLTVSPALFASAMTVCKARAAGRPVGIWVQDIYSCGFEETKVGSFGLSRAIKIFESRVFRSATGIAVIHSRFRDYLINEMGVAPDRIQVIRNWSHVEIPQGIDRESARARFGWKPNEVIALHAGNMGVKQDLGNIVEAAREASSNGSSVRFVLLGDGNQRSKLEKAAKGIPKVTFMTPLPDADFAAALQAADVLLVNELPGVKEMSVPSKLTSYFTTGQPIIAATEPDSATADEIRASGSGIHVQSGDPMKLLRAVEELAADPELAAQCSASGVAYAQVVLSEERAISEFDTWINKLATRS